MFPVALHGLFILAGSGTLNVSACRPQDGKHHVHANMTKNNPPTRPPNNKAPTRNDHRDDPHDEHRKEHHNPSNRGEAPHTTHPPQPARTP